MEPPATETQISVDEASRLGASYESHFLDRKSRRISPGKLSRSVSALANADGGELIIGIEDDGSWDGFRTPEDANAHIQVVSEMFAFGSDFSYSLLSSDELPGLVLHLTVQKTREIKKATDGTPYIRRGASNLPVNDPEGLRNLERAKGLTSHEAATLRYDLDEISNSEVVIGFMLGVVPGAEPESWLRKQQLIVDDNPTVAGTVLFHDEPQVHLPKAAAKIYRYETSDREGSRDALTFDPISIDGCAYDVIRKSVDRTVQEVEKIPLLAEEGLQAVQYPHETLHEIITNAVLHRDYSIHDDVHVRIFDNRVEVESPGRLPAHITPENILRERFARNPALVRIINKFPNPPNKDVGEGLNTAFEAMRKLHLREPEIIHRESSVLVVIRHEKLASPESRIVEFLESGDSINNSQARELLGIDSEVRVRKLFEKLVDSGEIERVPGTIKGGSRYQRRRRG